MNQVYNIFNIDKESAKNNDSNRFETCEEVVEDLVSQGLPRIYNPCNFISKIAQVYGISTTEARTCLRLAVKQLEVQKKEEDKNPNEQLNGACGYFYPGANTSVKKQKNDGFDSLSSLGSYNKLMFKIR